MTQARTHRPARPQRLSARPLAPGLASPAPKRARAGVIALVAGALALSCGSLGGLSDALSPYTPKLRFDRLALQSIDFQQVAVDFVFAIDNPNPLEVELATFSYALGLADHPVLRGSNDDGVKLEARGSSQLVLPVSVRFSDIFAVVDDARGKDRLPFRISGDFGFNTPVGVVKVPYEETGDFPVVHAPDVSLEGLDVGKIDVMRQTARLELALGLRNDGAGSPLSFSGLDYAITLGGARVGTGAMSEVGQAAPGAREIVTIPLDLNLANLGASIVRAITGRTSVDVGLSATVQVGTPFGAIPLTIDEGGDLRIQ